MCEQVFKKIKELGRVNSKREDLLLYCNQQFDQILKHIPRRILNSDGECVLDCILNGLSDDTSRNKVKIIELILKAMRAESTSLTHCGGVVSRLCMELPRLPLENLVGWCNDSVQSIVDDSDVNMIWRDVLPECMRVITSNYDSVKHCDTEMASTDYKEQCVHTLCQCRWNEKQLVQLVAMFKDMQLSKASHKQVVNKICTYIIDIPPDTLPPLVHQLMKLCKTYNLDIVFGHLSNYFSVRLYSKLEPPPQDSESTTMDIDDIVPHSAAELSRCLSTCIYHISQGAVEPELIRKHIKTWPKSQLLRSPFIIDLALAISDKGRDFRTVCIDAVRSAIEQRAMDELRCKESAWIRSVIPPDVDVASVLKVLTTESANHRELTVIGLINLAFSLLAVSRVKACAYTCWSHGKLVLVRLTKSQPETASHILSQLADKLATDCSLKQYADCLYVLCKLTPVSVERCTQLSTILENCRPLPTEYRSAAAVFDAVHPLLNFSTRCRDTLFMVCRKGLYSRDSLHRCLALSGFLTVLRHMKLSRGVFSSSQSVCSEQYAHSAHSYLTQLTVDFHATEQGATVSSRVHNESVCMEVVSILRRCLMQDASVKHLLYTSIYDCAKEKPALHECILEMFCEHLSKYLPDGDSSTPILWDKCVQMTGATAVLSEPIAHLLYTISQFLQSTEEDSLEDILASQSVETASAHLKSTLTITLDKLCASDNLGQVDLEDPGLSDITPESKAKCIKVQQILQCYETLIAYKIMTWKMNSDAAGVVYKLYKDCNQLLELTKVTPKAAKKTKSLNETKETKTQRSQSQKENKKASTKVANLVKDRSGPFKALPCVWDLRVSVKILQLLYSEEVPWCSIDQRNQIRGRRDFHHWTLRCVQSVLCEHVERRNISHVLTMATLLYERCVCRLMCEFDDQTTLSCLDLFKSCLNLLFSKKYDLKTENILEKITNTTDVPLSTSIAAILEHIYTALMQIELESELEERDAMMKKLLASLFGIATVLLEVPTPGCSNMCNVIVKFEDYVRTSKQDWLSLLSPLLAAAARDQQEAPLLEELLTKLTIALGRIDAVRSAIEQRAMDELRCKESAWIRSVIPPDVDVASVLKVLTTESANHRELTVIGLINLAFSLLAVSRVKACAYTCWSHGKLVLVRLTKSQPETASHILSQLADKLATDCSLKQYADCLYVLCKLTPVSVERCTQLSTILENCRPLPTEYRSAAAVFDAVHPLLNFSTRCRDTLFMVCRKGLYSRDSLHRCLALSGFLTVLRHMKLSRGVFSSSQSVCSEQYAHSAHSYLTQLTVDFHATEQGATVSSRVHNESVCMEVVSILRRCLMQDASVKHLLYTSIYDCAKEKPALHECILEMFCEHLSKYLPDGDSSTPILWDKCVQMTGATAVLSEPIAHLLYTISQFLQSTEEDSLEDILASQSVETASAHLKSTLTITLDKLCASDNLGQVDLEDPGLSDITPESKAKCIKVQQILQCYETLIAYKIMTWKMNSDAAGVVYKLYKDCNQLLELTKVTPKAAKKTKSLNETKETKTQRSQSQKENKKASTKVANLVKDRSGPFKALPCVWDLRVSVKILQLLYSEEVPWCSIDQRNQIRGRRDFHHWTLRCVQSVLCEHVERRNISHVLTMATLLYERCVCRFRLMCEFDDQTTLSCLDLFKSCLNLLFSKKYDLKTENILEKITNTTDVPLSTSIAAILEHIYTALMQIELESELEERDAMMKKLLASLFGIATVLLEVPTPGCSNMCNVIVKFEDYVRTSKQDWLSLLSPLLAAAARDQQEAPLLEELLTKLTIALGRIDEEDTSAGSEECTIFPFIDARSGHTALSHVCTHLAVRARAVSHLLQRARDVAAAVATSRNEQRLDRELKELYKSSLLQLCQLSSWCGRGCKLRCAVGSGSDKLLAACAALYGLLARFANQLDVDTAQIVRFERLLKLSGKRLSTITDNLITYIEASQEQQSASKVLRDTKLIPRLVLEAEQYSKNVTLLARKCKVDWQHYLSLGTARDFRIKTSVLEEVLNTRDRADNEETRDDDEAINDVSTEVPSVVDAEDCDRRKKRRVS